MTDKLELLQQIAEQGKADCEDNFRIFGVSSFAKRHVTLWVNLLDELQRLRAVTEKASD